MTTYTMIDGSNLTRHLSAEDAGRLLLEHDGYAWDVACMIAADPELDGKRYYVLRHSDGSVNSTRGASHFVETIHSTYARSLGEATTQLLAEVGEEGPEGWRHASGLEIVSDAEYDRMLAEDAA